MQTATLVLEDGTVLTGEAFGARANTVFELVFNTSMTGYQEILTDPSYRGQGILFTSPHIGNTGINNEDNESAFPQVSAVVVREISRSVSSWRSTASLPDWLEQHGVPGISGVDTRYLTRKLRDGGTLKAALSTCDTPASSLIEMARNWPGLDGRDMVQEVSREDTADFNGDSGSLWLEPPQAASGRRVVVFDYGAKRNILRHLLAQGLSVTVVPACTSFAEMMALQPDGIVLSNGPGDPAGLPRIVEVVRDLVDSGTPIFGICLGHQLIGRAIGGTTMRLKFGHHSGNHPVLELATHKVAVTSQNHNYAVDIDSLDLKAVEVTHLSLNDHTLEGMRLVHQPVFSVQYHPEASPGPHDAQSLFGQFVQLIHQKAAEVGYAKTH